MVFLFCVRWSSRPWTRRATPTCRGLWSRVRRPREESTPSTRPLFSNIHLPCPLLCVCAFQRSEALYWGPAPELGSSDARRRVTSPAEKQNKTPPPPIAEPVHCMMTFGAALSLSLSLSSSSSSSLSSFLLPLFR